MLYRNLACLDQVMYGAVLPIRITESPGLGIAPRSRENSALDLGTRVHPKQPSNWILTNTVDN